MDKISLRLWSTTEITNAVSIQFVSRSVGWWPKRDHSIHKSQKSTWEYLKVHWLRLTFTYSWTTYHDKK
ncbi:MAG: hypothetical protein ACXABY_36690 [Candidatus Thorarchaeota archaeon]|jgi:hypothetical protein